MVRLTELKDDLSQEDETKKRRTIQNHRSPRTGDLQIKTSEHLANPRRVPRSDVAVLLKQYKENETYGEIFSKPPAELLDREEVYDVETILNH